MPFARTGVALLPRFRFPEATMTTEPEATHHTALHRRAEHLTDEIRELWHKTAADELWHKTADKLRKPWIGATIAGAAVLAAGAVWGASEAAVAAVAAYAVFRMLRKRARSHPRVEADGDQTSAPAT
jgi:hypothetical protein